MDIRGFLSRLPSARQTQQGYQARCPSHDDGTASLSIRAGTDGRILLKCFAGCSVEQIVDSLGLEVRDLFPDTPASSGRPFKGSPPEATYRYADENGVLLAEKLRYPGKVMRWRRPDGRGGWLWDRNGVQVPLYRLHQIAKHKSPTVIVVEGEKDADRVWSLGWPATTASDGAKGWRDDYAAQLKAAHVSHIVILPDNDEPGRRYGIEAASSCHKAGLVVKVVNLPDLAAGGDVSDFLAAHSRQKLQEAIRAAPLWTPESPALTADAPVTSPSTGGLELTTMAQLLQREAAQDDWIWRDRIAAGALAVIVGKPKCGKSTLLRCLALAVSRGMPFLGWDTTQGTVWYVALEERGQDIRDHFVALGATDSDPIHFFVGQAPVDVVQRLHVQAGIERPALIIIDPLQRFLRVRDLNDYASTSNKFDPIIAVASDTGAAIVLSHHSPKDDRDDVDAALGSIGIAGSVHTQLVMRRKEKCRTLTSIQRTGPDLEATVLELDPVTRWLSAGLTEVLADEAAAESAILAVLGDAASPLSEPDLRDRVRLRTGLASRTLRVLRDRGRVSRTGAGTRGQPFLYAIAADSRSLVPAMVREGENEKPATGLDARNPASDSRSHPGVAVGEWERASEPSTDCDEEVIPL